MSLDEWLGYPKVASYKGVNLRDPFINYAYVFANTTIDDILVYSVNRDCFHCPYQHEATLQAGQEKSWLVDTTKQKFWRIEKRKHEVGDFKEIAPNHRRGWLCQMRPTFQEYGVYRLEVGKCEIKTEVPPANTYFPLVLCSLVLLGICAAYSGGKFLWSRRKRLNENNNEKIFEINAKKMEDGTPSINVFRGLLLSIIIFATTGGGRYPIFLKSVNTNGISFTECLFFAFAWSVGLNLPTIMNEALNEKTRCSIFKDILLRSIALLFVDFAIYGALRPDSESVIEELWRPLLRLGIAYLVVASAYLLTMQKFELKSKKIICKAISNLISLMWCWIISGFLLSIMVILISTLISFNCLSNLPMSTSIDYSEKLPDESQNCNNGISLTANEYMINRHEKVVNVHGYVGFSQGVLGQMSTLMFTMVGLKAGLIYANYKTHSDRLKLWCVWTLLFGLGGVFFAAVSYPLEFNLWPIASILLISTLIMLTFSFVYIVTEVWKFSGHIISSAGITSLMILPAHILLSNSSLIYWIRKFDLKLYLSLHLTYVIHSYIIVFIWLLISLIIIKKKIKFDI